MTKAERIFKNTLNACKNDIKTWGYKEAGFSRMITEGEEDELIYTRTANEIKKLIEKEYRNIVIDNKLGVITEKEAEFEAQAVKMVELTLENQYIA